MMKPLMKEIADKTLADIKNKKHSSFFDAATPEEMKKIQEEGITYIPQESEKSEE